MVHGHRNPYQLQGAIVERITVIEGDEASSREDAAASCRAAVGWDCLGRGVGRQASGSRRPTHQTKPTKPAAMAPNKARGMNCGMVGSETGSEGLSAENGRT